MILCPTSKNIFVTSVKYFQAVVSTPSTWATSRACSAGPWPPTPPTGGRGCTRSAPPWRQLPRPRRRRRRPRRGRGWSTSPRRGPAPWTADRAKLLATLAPGKVTAGHWTGLRFPWERVDDWRFKSWASSIKYLYYFIFVLSSYIVNIMKCMQNFI